MDRMIAPINVHSITHPLRATLHASYYRTLRSLRVRGDDPNAPTLIFMRLLEEGAYPLDRWLLRGRMIVENIRSQVPNKVLTATPSPIDPAEQLLPRLYPSALSQLFRPLLEVHVLLSLRRLGR